TCTIHVKFIPRLPNDIESELPFLAQTGKFSIPLCCYTKKVVVKVEPDDYVDFGGVVIAEYATKTIRISNSGALDTSFQLCGEAVDTYTKMKCIPKSQDEKDVESVLTFSTLSGYLEHESSVVIKITFRPGKIGVFKTQLKIRFNDDFTEDVVINLYAEGRDVPIYLERTEMDLKCVYFNTLYRDPLIVHNRGKFAMKCEFK